MTAQLIPTEVDDFFIEKQISLKEDLQKLVQTASDIEVTNDDLFRKITSLYADSKDWEKRIDFMRKEANGPDQDRINTRNDKAKEILTPLKQIQTIARQKCERYQLRLEEAKKAEEQKLQEAVDLLGLDETPVVAPLEKAIRGDGAIMYSRTVRKFRVVELSKVPEKYLQVNEDLIARDIKMGIDNIPGIEIYETKETQLKTR